MTSSMARRTYCSIESSGQGVLLAPAPIVEGGLRSLLN
jgi:hypothetical protein